VEDSFFVYGFLYLLELVVDTQTYYIIST